MKKIFIVIIILIGLGLLFVRLYQSSPGYVTQKAMDEFYRAAKKCSGISILINEKAVATDAPGQSICFGWLH